MLFWGSSTIDLKITVFSPGHFFSNFSNCLVYFKKNNYYDFNSIDTGQYFIFIKYRIRDV